MSHIVITWELGSHLGHITRFLPLALKLRDAGHKILFILKDLSRAYDTLVKYGFAVYQAPVWLHRAKNITSPPANFSEILILFGYLDDNGLKGMVSGWCSLYDQLQPDMVLFDHSPTGLLAARSYPFKKVLFGSGFFHPLHTVPTPNIRTEEDIPARRLELSEQRVVKVINKVLDNFNMTPLQHLYDLFQVDEEFLMTFPELDHYQGRTDSKYWGTLTTDEGGIDPEWPSGDKPKVFAYLKPEYKQTPAVLQAISQMDCQALIFSPNLPQSLTDKFSKADIQFSTHRYKIRTIADQCDIAITHAGHDTVTTMLMAGKPLLLLPMQQEQTLLARNVERIGAGIIGFQDDAIEKIQEKLHQLLSEPGYRQSAQAFADKYRNSELVNALDIVTKRCMELL